MPRMKKIKKVMVPGPIKKKVTVEPVVVDETPVTVEPAVVVEPVKVDAVEPKTVKVKKPRKSNPWILHSKKIQAENPGISYREVLKLAKLSYKKE